MAWLKPITLKNEHCHLAPLSLDHLKGLKEAVKDGALFENPYAQAAHPDKMENDIKRRLQLQKEGALLPFTVIDLSDNQIKGMTSYCQIDSESKRLDIGFTWLCESAQRTRLNTACKLTLLTHAFETLKVIAVGFRVDRLNSQSHHAVLRLGAKLDGVFRHYSRLPNGTLRDMYFYSILPSEWEYIKVHLTYQLNKKH